MRNIKNYLTHLFFPTDRNEYRARVLHNDTLTAYLIVIFLIAFTFKFTPFGTGKNVMGVATNINVEKLLQDTNEERRKNNLPVLTYSPKLAQAAELKAKDMMLNNYWAHYSPQGKTPWDFLQEVDYKYEYAGENLAKNFMFSDQVVSGWMNSPTHRENILRKEFSQVGFAIQNGSLENEETTLVVQMFGKPLPVELGGVPEQGIAIEAPAQVLSESAQKSAVPTFALYASYLFIGFLVLALFADLFAISRVDVTRLHGKNTAHLIFLIAILIGLTFFITKGVIL